MNQFSVALQNETGVVRFGETKSGKFKEGSLARAIVFMNKQERMTAGQALYAKWFATGQFRPIAEDILQCGLFAKSAIPAIRTMSGLRDAGQVPKDVLVRLCMAVVECADAAARIKASKEGKFGEDAHVQYLPKSSSDKGFVLGLCRAVASGAKLGDVVDNVVDEA